jgi:hypothetical protein
MTITTTGAEARANIKERLRKLLNMTIDNGATEAEALAAAQKAADLMAEHDLTYDKVDEVKAEPYGASRWDVNCGMLRKRPHEVRYVASEVGRLFNCRTWRDGSQRVFFGTEVDAWAAHSMCGVICFAMEAAFEAYLSSPERRRSRLPTQSLRPSFMSGMAMRINSRLVEIRRAREVATRQAVEGTGRALVLVTKQEQVAAKFQQYAAENDLRLQSSRRHLKRRSSSAHAAGDDAGSRVNLGSAAIAGGVKMVAMD